MISARITDGTMIVNLNDADPFEILEFDFGYGDPSEREISGSLRLYANGNFPSMPRGDPVQGLREAVQKLQKLLQQAINYWRYDKGAQIKDSDATIVYLEVKIQGTEDYYRTPITQARYSMPNDSTWNLSIGGTNVIIEYVIDFARKNWWEGPQEQIALTTLHETTETTSPVDVWNPKAYVEDTVGGAISFTATTIDDSSSRLDIFPVGTNVIIRGSTSNDGIYAVGAGSTASSLNVKEYPSGDPVPSAEPMPAGGFILGADPANWVEIAKDATTGDLPSSVLLNFANSSTETLYELWVGHWFRTPPATDEGMIVLEAEDGVYEYIADLVSPTDPPASGGDYIEYDEPFQAAKESYGYCQNTSTTTIAQLSLTDKSLDDTWNNHIFYVVSDPNGLTGLYRTITDYNYDPSGNDRAATLSSALPSAPTTSTQYAIYAAGTTQFTTVALVPIYWNLSGELSSYYRGRYFKAILKLYDDSGSPDDYNYQLRMRRQITKEVIWEGPIVRYGYDTNLEARDLGTFRIPPTWSYETYTGDVYLELVLTPFDDTVTEVNGIRIDYLMLLPVDGFRYFAIITGIDTDNELSDNGYFNQAYYSKDGYIFSDVIGRGNQIMLQPGIAQRLYFFQGEDITKTGRVTLYYRPRRLSI